MQAEPVVSKVGHEPMIETDCAKAAAPVGQVNGVEVREGLQEEIELRLYDKSAGALKSNHVCPVERQVLVDHDTPGLKRRLTQTAHRVEVSLCVQ